MIIVKVKCDCGKWIRLRAETDSDSVSCWNCGRALSVSRSGGTGARIIAKCGNRVLDNRRIDVEYED